MKSVAHQNLIKLEEVFETKKVKRRVFYSSFVWNIGLIVFISKQKLYLITELCEAGELAKWIKKQGPIPEPESRLIMKQIVDAISYLHKNGTFVFFNFPKYLKFIFIFIFCLDIVHRDLKLENILIKEFDPQSDTFFIKVWLVLLRLKF